MNTPTLPAKPPIRKLFHFIKKYPLASFFTAVFIALAIRIYWIPNAGFEADISFWKSWGLAVYDHNIVWSIKNTNNNYPTAFAYVLGLMARVYSLLADPHNFYEFWNNQNLLFLTIAKIPAVAADFAIAGIIIWLGKNAKKIGFPQFPLSFYAVLAIAYLLSPVSIMDSAWWGQVDSLGVFVFLVSLIFALKKMPFIAGFIYMASMMTKLQNMIYGPVYFIFLWQLMGFKGLIKAVAGATLAFAGLNFEFFLAREMKLVFESLTVNYDYFPFMSLNAYNLWWIVAGADGMHTLDKFSVLGMTNAKSMGLYIFSSFYLLAVVLMVRETITKMWKKGIDPKAEADVHNLLYRFFTGLMIVAGAFFLFQTESHDRYAFPITVFFPLWATFFLWTASTVRERRQIFSTRQFQIVSFFYLIFTVFYFYNMHTALVDNYPQNGLPYLKDLVQPAITIFVSYIQIALFVLFLYAVSRHSPLWLYVFPAVLFITILGLQNLPLLTKKPVSVNKFFPIISQQGYGSRQVDMPVNAFNGINNWSFLSVQYAFYRHGIGTHAKSYQLYDINGLFTKFTTDVGIDTEAGADGSASFEVYGDDKLLQKVDKIGRFDYPKHIEVDITGVKKLGLVTNDAGDGINNDHTDWLNPLLWP